MEIGVAILAVLVTVLIGWQIYTVVDIRKRVRVMAQAEIAKAVAGLERKAYEYRCESIGTAMYNIAEYEMDNGAYNFAFKCMLRALCELYEENPASGEVSLCFEQLQCIIEALRREEKFIAVPKNVRMAMVDGLLKIKDRRRDVIVDYIIDEIKIADF